MYAMTRSKRLEPVSDLNHSREREAARELGRYQEALNAQQSKLAELAAYREEYSRRYLDTLKGGLGAGTMQEYQHFLGRLSEAIGQQELRVAQAERELESARARWIATRLKAEALDRVMDRYRADEQRARDRREQREEDERAQRGRGEGGGH